MKKILVLTSRKDARNKKQFVKLVSENFKNNDVDIELGDIHDVFICFGDKPEVFYKDINIKEFKLIVFRGITAADRSIASVVAILSSKLGVKYIDKIYGFLGTTENKLVSLAKLYSKSLPLPETCYIGKKPSKELFKKVSERLGLPFVAKDLLKQRGLGVCLIKNEKEFCEFKYPQIYQKIINKDHEYRVLVLGKDVGVFEEKIATKKGEFRNNVALGAREIFLDKKTIPPKIKKISVKSSKTLNLDIAGVDVVIEKGTGKIYLLEVNRGPGLTYSKDSPEFAEIANYLEKHA